MQTETIGFCIFCLFALFSGCVLFFGKLGTAAMRDRKWTGAILLALAILSGSVAYIMMSNNAAAYAIEENDPMQAIALFSGSRNFQELLRMGDEAVERKDHMTALKAFTAAYYHGGRARMRAEGDKWLEKNDHKTSQLYYRAGP